MAERKPLRNFGMITESRFVGKTETEASAIAENDGFEVRIVERDGNSFMVTHDFRNDRINFRLRNDIVIGAHGG